MGSPGPPRNPLRTPGAFVQRRGDDFRLGNLLYPLLQEKFKLDPPMDPRVFLNPPKDPRGVCSSRGDDFRLDDLFY